MKLKKFNYSLPRCLIAQYPSDRRDESKFMVLDRDSKTIKHEKFKHITNYLRSGDVMVINKSKVVPARLFGKRVTGAKVELLLLNLPQGKRAKVLTKSNASLKEGEKLIFNEGKLEGRVYSTGKKVREFEFIIDNKEKLKKLIKKLGHIPLPPYIDRKAEKVDLEKYQTIYAEEEGSIASPTAGLHFTPSLLQDIKNMGVTIAEVVLHISYATFNPVEVEEIENHQMYKEYYEVPEETINVVKRAQRQGGRIIAIGTTSCRVLETLGEKEEKIEDMGVQSGWTDLFIYPPYEFKFTDVLLTNFHLPKSTLLMLVSAFAGKDLIMKAYKEAIKQRYRFYSYGDCMLIL